MQHSQKTALVIGNDTRSFLAVIRSLGRAGIAVDVAGSPAAAPALQSRYVRQAHTIRSYDVDALYSLLTRRHFDLVIPCDDFSMVPLQAQRARFEAVTRVSLLNDEAFAICSDKSRTYELAAQLGIPVARQRRAETIEEIEASGDEFGWPLVLKPLRSVTAREPGVRHSVCKVRSRAELTGVDELPVLVQENFVGIGVGVEVLCDDGEVLVAFQHERVHEPVTGGGSSYRRSVPLSPPLLDAVRRLMHAVRYTGVGMVEFKVNPATGQWILIEINGRFWGSLPLSIAAGADFPRYLFEMLTDGRRDFPRRYTPGVYARDWMIDMRWFARNLLSDRRDPTLMTRPLWKVWLEVLNLPREHSDTLTSDDPAPAWAEASRALRNVIGLAVDRPRALRTFRRARRFLFVCKGNICRSPFAEYYLRARALPGVVVESAGHFPMSGRQVPPNAVAAARELGVDLQSHRSRILDEPQVARADVILVFDQENHDEVRGWFPHAAGKLHYLAPLAGRMRIPDPGGWHTAALREVYRSIGRALDVAAAGRSAVAAEGDLACS